MKKSYLLAVLLVLLSPPIYADSKSDASLPDRHLVSSYGGDVVSYKEWTSLSMARQQIGYLNGYRRAAYLAIESYCIEIVKQEKENAGKYYAGEFRGYNDCFRQFLFYGSSENLSRIVSEIYSKDKYQILSLEDIMKTVISSQISSGTEIDYAKLYTNLDMLLMRKR